MFYKFMLISQCGNTLLSEYSDFIKKCADGGITSLQLREKSLDNDSLHHMGEHLLNILAPYNIPLIINDNISLAKEIGSDYVHIGQQDGSIEHALLSNPNIKLGVSIESKENLLEANTYENLAYVTASAVFATDNKHNVKTLWGLDGLNMLAGISRHPITAIGGITLENVSEIIHHGAQGIAIIGALHNSPNPYHTAKQLRQLLDNSLGGS